MEKTKMQNGRGQTGKPFSTRFILPGLVNYKEHGNILVRKEMLDNMSSSFVGKPVFNWMHKEVKNDDFSKGTADGIVTRVWFNPDDGWFWADGLAWDQETIENCKKKDSSGQPAFSVSCAYDVHEWSNSGGLHNNIEYAREALKGEYTHLAIVENPRYEGAKIIMNSQGGNMKLWFLKKDKPEEIELSNSTIQVDGKEVEVSKLVEVYNATNTAPTPITEAEFVEINGKKISMTELKNNYSAKLKNESDEAEKKKKEKEAADLKNAEDKMRKEKEDEDKKNEEMKNAKEKEERERLEREGDTNFSKILNAASARNPLKVGTSLITIEEKIAEGKKCYGSVNPKGE